MSSLSGGDAAGSRSVDLRESLQQHWALIERLGKAAHIALAALRTAIALAPWEEDPQTPDASVRAMAAMKVAAIRTQAESSRHQNDVFIDTVLRHCALLESRFGTFNGTVKGGLLSSRPAGAEIAENLLAGDRFLDSSLTDKSFPGGDENDVMEKDVGVCDVAVDEAESATLSQKAEEGVHHSEERMRRDSPIRDSGGSLVGSKAFDFGPTITKQTEGLSRSDGDLLKRSRRSASVDSILQKVNYDGEVVTATLAGISTEDTRGKFSHWMISDSTRELRPSPPAPGAGRGMGPAQETSGNQASQDGSGQLAPDDVSQDEGRQKGFRLGLWGLNKSASAAGGWAEVSNPSPVKGTWKGLGGSLGRRSGAAAQAAAAPGKGPSHQVAGRGRGMGWNAPPPPPDQAPEVRGVYLDPVPNGEAEQREREFLGQSGEGEVEVEENDGRGGANDGGLHEGGQLHRPKDQPGSKDRAGDRRPGAAGKVPKGGGVPPLALPKKKGEGGGATWQCTMCTLENEGWQKRCAACESPKMGSVAATEALGGGLGVGGSPAGPGAGKVRGASPQQRSKREDKWGGEVNWAKEPDWPCAVCTLLNDVRAVKCAACGHHKGATSDDAALPPAIPVAARPSVNKSEFAKSRRLSAGGALANERRRDDDGDALLEPRRTRSLGSSRVERLPSGRLRGYRLQRRGSLGEDSGEDSGSGSESTSRSSSDRRRLRDVEPGSANDDAQSDPGRAGEDSNSLADETAYFAANQEAGSRDWNAEAGGAGMDKGSGAETGTRPPMSSSSAAVGLEERECNDLASVNEAEPSLSAAGAVILGHAPSFPSINPTPHSPVRSMRTLRPGSPRTSSDPCSPSTHPTRGLWPVSPRTFSDPNSPSSPAFPPSPLSRLYRSSSIADPSSAAADRASPGGSLPDLPTPSGTLGGSSASASQTSCPAVLKAPYSAPYPPPSPPMASSSPRFNTVVERAKRADLDEQNLFALISNQFNEVQRRSLRHSGAEPAMSADSPATFAPSPP